MAAAGIPFRAIGIQAGVVGALVLRETKTRFGASGAGWVWLLFEPLLQCLFYVVLYEFIRSRVSPLKGVDVAEFMLSGIIPWLFYFRTSIQVMHSIESNRALLIYPQVTPLDIALARTFLETTIMYVVVFFFLLLQWFVLGAIHVGDLLGLLSACFCLSIMGLGVGLIVMALDHFVPGLMLVFTYINRLLYFTSGIFFTLSAVPSYYLSYVDWNPLLQAVEWGRASYFDNVSTELLNLKMLALAVPALLALGVLAERTTREIAKRVSTS
ncbi:MAG TPA: ABC transporter permease [Rhizomicrobium sp.]|nr:ABC transporter permease [Rhizomicrobium sp.]